MVTKKTETTKKETPATSSGQAKEKKAKPVAKPANKSKEPLVEKPKPAIDNSTANKEEEPIKEKEIKEDIDRPDEEMKCLFLYP